MTERQSIDDLLIAHAAGKLPEPVALAVATHLALNPAARARYRGYEAVGGVMLDELEPAPSADDAWDRLEASLDAPRRQADPALDCRAVAEHLVLPQPLRDYLPGPLEALRWRNYGTASDVELPIKAPGYRTALIKVRAGRKVPQHTHEGSELTVVLDGAFHDETGHYVRGDLVIADASLDHRPMADDQGDPCTSGGDGRTLAPDWSLRALLNPFFIRF